MRHVERRLVAAAGEELAVAAAEVPENSTVFLLSGMRYSMMARAFSLRAFEGLPQQLFGVGENELCVGYSWLGVTDGQGIMIAATEPALLAKISAKPVA